MDSGYIISRRPYRENSFLLDLLTQESGRIVCIARVAKKRGRILKGSIEPFRLLRLNWTGRGDVQTLTMADEQGRHRLPPATLCKGLYLNELLLRLIPQHAPTHEVFPVYQDALHQLVANDDELTLLHSEISLLEALGYPLNLCTDSVSGKDVAPQILYRHSLQYGLRQDGQNVDGIPISGRLLSMLCKGDELQLQDRQELRKFINQMIDVILAGKPLNSRSLVFI